MLVLLPAGWVGGGWVVGGGNMSVAKTSVLERMPHYIQELCNECHQPHSHIPKQARSSHLSSTLVLYRDYLRLANFISHIIWVRWQSESSELSVKHHQNTPRDYHLYPLICSLGLKESIVSGFSEGNLSRQTGRLRAREQSCICWILITNSWFNLSTRRMLSSLSCLSSRCFLTVFHWRWPVLSTFWSVRANKKQIDSSSSLSFSSETKLTNTEPTELSSFTVISGSWSRYISPD